MYLTLHRFLWTISLRNYNSTITNIVIMQQPAPHLKFSFCFRKSCGCNPTIMISAAWFSVIRMTFAAVLCRLQVKLNAPEQEASFMQLSCCESWCLRQIYTTTLTANQTGQSELQGMTTVMAWTYCSVRPNLAKSLHSTTHSREFRLGVNEN